MSKVERSEPTCSLSYCRNDGSVSHTTAEGARVRRARLSRQLKQGGRRGHALRCRLQEMHFYSAFNEALGRIAYCLDAAISGSGDDNFGLQRLSQGSALQSSLVRHRKMQAATSIIASEESSQITWLMQARVLMIIVIYSTRSSDFFQRLIVHEQCSRQQRQSADAGGPAIKRCHKI